MDSFSAALVDSSMHAARVTCPGCAPLGFGLGGLSKAPWAHSVCCEVPRNCRWINACQGAGVLHYTPHFSSITSFLLRCRAWFLGGSPRVAWSSPAQPQGKPDQGKPLSACLPSVPLAQACGDTSQGNFLSPNLCLTLLFQESEIRHTYKHIYSPLAPWRSCPAFACIFAVRKNLFPEEFYLNSHDDGVFSVN